MKSVMKGWEFHEEPEEEELWSNPSTRTGPQTLRNNYDTVKETVS